jgi:UDP-N-acetylglucosamine 2-epimerase (non-hydrolysing)
MRLVHVVGARPNLMKLAPVYRAFAGVPDIEQSVVHTGQHYDLHMSDVFFQQLGLKSPDVNLHVGSASHTKQVAEIMVRFEKVLSDTRPDLVLVYGDVNSTIAAALVCSKMRIRLGHVEAGLRSFDRSMPEEINRLLTDQIADFLFTPSEDANQNLAREGVPAEVINLVGNVMIDSLVRMLPACQMHLPPNLPSHFALVTLHRPSNVDDLPWLDEMLQSLAQIAARLPILFPVHPRTKERMIGLRDGWPSALRLMEPLPYLAFLALEQQATVVITDSGGIQEETTYLGVPCLTIRENTERPITIKIGTNILVGRDQKRIRDQVEQIISGVRKKGKIPPLWDGHAAERIVEVIHRLV